MIWNSPALMTAIDLAIVGAAAYLVFVFLAHYRVLGRLGSLLGVWSAILGVAVIASLYLADLYTMHVLPARSSEHEAMAAMRSVHLEWSWIATLLGVGLLVAGLGALLRKALPRIVDNLAALGQARDELRASAARFRDAAEVSSDWIWEVDPDGRLTYLPARLEWLIGKPIDAILGRPREEVAAALGLRSEQWDSVAAEVAARRTFRDFCCESVRGDGSVLHLAVSGKPVFGEDGTYLGYRGAGRNITAEVEARALAGRNERLAAIGRMTATVSHELRNPLGAIHASARVIRHFAADGPQETLDAVARIERGTERCNRIIGELLNYVREHPPELGVIDLGEWLAAALEDVAVAMNVKLEVDPISETAVLANSERLRQAFINLISNAAQALEPGGGTVSVRVRREGDRVALAVRDDGPGMDAEVLARTFEPLFSTRTFGVGLGLPLVARIMKEHGGSVDIHSRPGEGTTVTLWLPAAERPALVADP